MTGRVPAGKAAAVATLVAAIAGAASQSRALVICPLADHDSDTTTGATRTGDVVRCDGCGSTTHAVVSG